MMTALAIWSLIVLATAGLVFALPLSFGRKEQKFLFLGSVFIGTFGLLSATVIGLWQSFFLTMVLAISSGYIIGNRLGALPPAALKKINKEKVSQDNFREEKTIVETAKKDTQIKEQPVAKSTVVNSVPTLPSFVIQEDISFLDRRNEVHQEMLEEDTLQVLFFDDEGQREAENTGEADRDKELAGTYR